MSTTAPTKPVTTAPDYLATIRDGWAQAMQQWVDQSTTAWDQWSKGWAGALPPVPGVPGMQQSHPGKHGHHDHHDHDHHRHDHDHHDHACGCCGDGCDCCVPEADVVVHARAGEVRIVPFRLANHWRREREVTLAVGPWHVCSGQGLEIRGVLEEEKLVLAPCEDRVVRLLISVRGAKEGNDPTTPADPGTEQKADQGKAGDMRATTGRRTVDVEDCVSAYADVRFEGCSRPQRVAVVVSPAQCDPVDACCDCGCCC
ncbi:hypothetical protein [Nostocoides sp. HKS02]|uniref:hypothetical protein n=1 Tax=Nostocoides sp. HKS02 TaxID=1813880 RepID=UPI0018A84B6E|nr:hypothetical protein [Tetrasphaera sp. HKS02]